MRKRLCLTSLLGLCAFFMLPGGAWSQPPVCLEFQFDLFSRQEVPAVSSVARGYFFANLHQDPDDPEGPGLVWELFYPNGLDVTQAHIHLGQQGVNGGIMLFLCSNLGNGPAGTKPCTEVPEDGGITPDVSGHAFAKDIIGPTSQGLQAGDFFAFQRALRQGVAYVNVHTTQFPGGFIRAQLTPRPCTD